MGEHRGQGTAQAAFDEVYARPADEPFSSVVVADPGRDLMFDTAVYDRGAAAVHALRTRIGEEDFRTLMRRWATGNAGRTVTTADLVALAEQVSGEQLDQLFTDWVYAPVRPTGY